MKLVRWTRFTWDLAKLPAVDLRIDPHYRIRPGTRDDEKAVHSVISSAFSLDMDWADTYKSMKNRFDAEIDEVFERKEGFGLVVTHGSRVIGASMLNFEPSAGNHLTTGPAVLVEYRNRGLGSALLYQSLTMLRDHGIVLAHGITKGNAPAAKFMYPKFGSASEACMLEPQLVA